MKRKNHLPKNYPILKVILLIVCCFPILVLAQSKKLNYYLPDDVTYDSSIPTPESFLGYQIGDWHISHDQLVMYLKELAKVSDRITIEEYARSYEKRPLILLTITSAKNQKNIKKIQADHVALTDPDESANLDVQSMPAVIYQGYTIHGNEPSGSNAAPLYAYYLAAAQGDAIEKTLDNTVILLDPCYNPDGMNRFASWVNSHQSVHKNGDPHNRELNEAWPRGRTNHYWFDLNRDWLLLQHPESRGRIVKFHDWKPNILTDHHEMGGHSTFFFQPGIPSRVNPLIPAKNQELTKEISYFHGKALDKIGSLYYTKESFDDYYIGKGSTYPDLHGCIGILFEQASSRGHAVRTQHGLMDFPFTVRNQVKASLSTLEAAESLKDDLLNYQRDFYKNTAQEAQNGSVKAYVFGDKYDIQRTLALVHLLEQHKIEVGVLAEDIKKNGKTFKAKEAYVVSLNQKQHNLIKGLFDVRTQFRDSLFYDVSSWTMPYAFNLDYAKLTTLPQRDSLNYVSEVPYINKSEYAYVLKWDDYYAPRDLNFLLEKGIIAKVASKPFTIKEGGKTIFFDYGSIIIPVALQSMSSDELYQLLGIEMTGFYSVSSGYALSGVDLGSNAFKGLTLPKTLLVVGSGVTSYDAGEVWHLLDQRYDMELSIVEASRLKSVKLSDYNTIVMVNGSYRSIPSSTAKAVKDWVSEGGVIISFRSAIKWLKSNRMIRFKEKKAKKTTTPKKRNNYADSYANLSKVSGAQVIGGAIFEVEMDLTHPLAYGYHKNKMPVFRKGTTFIRADDNFNATPIVFAPAPLLSGYISKPNLDALGKSAFVLVNSIGKGRVISFSDNTNFRAFWYGTNKLFANALFFGRTINSSATIRTDEAEAVEEEAMEEGH